MVHSFNQLTYFKRRKKLFLLNANTTNKKYLHKSLAIGMRISQEISTWYPTPLDNFFKIVKGCKYYGRYMDDIYVIHHDKEFLKQILKESKKIATDLKILYSENKTRIIKLTRGFKFLKTRYFFTDTGKIIKKLDRKNITRLRKKLKKYRKKVVEEGLIPLEEYRNIYKSIRQNLIQNWDCWATIRKLDVYHNETVKAAKKKYGIKELTKQQIRQENRRKLRALSTNNAEDYEECNTDII